jgi:hypothetical protein
MNAETKVAHIILTQVGHYLPDAATEMLQRSATKQRSREATDAFNAADQIIRALREFYFMEPR